jgi:molecular chaperone DnaJ
VRAAYRERARIVHPDRRGVDPKAGAMSDVNEAYRVLSDPGRRMLYDRSLRRGDVLPEAAAEHEVDFEHDLRVAQPSRLIPAGPARIPWRMMLIAAVVGSAVILAASIFTDPPGTEPPDGILRIGSCVEIEANADVREVACTNTDTDVVVELFLPMGATCPGGLGAFRDRLGLGTACIELG